MTRSVQFFINFSSHLDVTNFDCDVCPDQLNCKLHFTITLYTFAIKSEALFGHNLAQCVCGAMMVAISRAIMSNFYKRKNNVLIKIVKCKMKCKV